MKKAVVILSGGLDSTILTYKVVDEYGSDNVTCLTFDYGQTHRIEIEKAKQTVANLGVEHIIIDMRFLSDIYKDVCALSGHRQVEMPTIKDVLGDPAPVTEVPYRNMIMLTIAMGTAQAIGAGDVYYGAQLHDEYSYWDTTHEFVKRMNAVSELNRKHRITIHAPFADLAKFEEIEIGKQLKVPFENTWTCYSGPDAQGRACGTCPSCSERISNFMKAGLKDPIEYAIDIDWKL